MKPFKGLKVLDLSTFVAAPCVCRFLSDLGADVIKVERPSGDGWRYTAILNIREVLARVKDVLVNIIRLPASVMGGPIDIHSSGTVTDDASTSIWLSEIQ